MLALLVYLLFCGPCIVRNPKTQDETLFEIKRHDSPADPHMLPDKEEETEVEVPFMEPEAIDDLHDIPEEKELEEEPVEVLPPHKRIAQEFRHASLP